jgi:type II secretory pathway pseudopilin PulG
MSKVLSSVVASALLVGGITIAAAQDLRGGQTITPQTAPNPEDPAVRDPQSPTASNRGDPGSEALNPNTGGPALGQGQQPAGTVGQAPTDRQVVPPNAQPDDARIPVPPKAAEPGTVGSGARTVGPEGARNDPHTLGTKDAPIPDPTRPTMAPTQGR